MAEIIADTSALIAFFVRTEAHHQDAQQYVATHSNMRWVILESVFDETVTSVSYTHLRAHETVLDIVCRLLLEKKKKHTIL